MIDPNILKMAAAVCSVLGSVLLAWRVKRILEALTFVADAHETNILQLMPDYQGDIYVSANSTKRVADAKGTGLLVFGFLLLGLSGALNIWALSI